jgi:hypothetical protein
MECRLLGQNEILHLADHVIDHLAIMCRFALSKSADARLSAVFLYAMMKMV